VRSVAPALLAAAALLAGCGSSSSSRSTGTAAAAAGATTTTRVEVVQPQGGGGGRLDAPGIYKREAPGVVTVISILGAGSGGGLLGGGGGQAAQGTGFVISGDGEIATNAHVVTDGEGPSIRRADKVFVQFADRNQVEAKIVGYDPNADVALLKIVPDGLHLTPLPLGRSEGLTVGDPVAAIGSPFDQPQSLSVGVISATARSIDSLTGFAIVGAIQTDAAINHGNSGGPLLDASGKVIGINSQIRSTGGGGEGVGFAIPVDSVKRSLDQLRSDGKVRYAYLGISTTPVYPQLAQHYKLATDNGVWVQTVVGSGPAADAGLRGGTGAEQRFQSGTYKDGGDVIVGLAGQPVRRDDDLSLILARHRPGESIPMEIFRDGKRRTIDVKVGERPANTRPRPQP